MDHTCRQYPGLLYTKCRVDELRRRIEERVEFRTAWQRISDKAEALLLEEFFPEERVDEPDNQHGDYAKPGDQIGRMAMTLGLAYQVTGHSRYAEKLRSALLYYSRYQKWHGKGLRRNDPPWHSELNTARFCFGFAVGYDSIHDYLSESDRKTIVDAVARLGILPTLGDWILPEKRVHALDSMGHNWWSVCVAEAGLAALSIIDDDSRAKGWVDAVVEAFPLWFDYRGERLLNKSPNFDEGGAFYESVNYANYALYEYFAVSAGPHKRSRQAGGRRHPSPRKGWRVFPAHLLPYRIWHLDCQLRRRLHTRQRSPGRKDASGERVRRQRPSGLRQEGSNRPERARSRFTTTKCMKAVMSWRWSRRQ